MVPRKPPTRKFVKYLRGLDESFAFRAAVPIFECCRAYRQDFGYLDAEIVQTVANKLCIGERMAIFCSHFPNLFFSLQKYRRNGWNNKIRLNLSESDRIGFDAYLTLNQLSRLGGKATASRLQRTMSGCHLVYAEDLQKAIEALKKINLVAEKQFPSRQWWNPRRSYSIKDCNNGPNANEAERVQDSRCSGALAG